MVMQKQHLSGQHSMAAHNCTAEYENLQLDYLMLRKNANFLHISPW